MEPLRILIVDDHTLVRKGVRALLETHDEFIVVGEATDGQAAIVEARNTMPEVILMDIEMPVLSGLEACTKIKMEMPHTHIIMLTVSDDDADLFEAIKRGADGYLLKNLTPDQLFQMLLGLRQGEAAISCILATKIIREFAKMKANSLFEQPLANDLTVREVQVLEQLMLGRSNAEIATELFVSENTIKIHVRNILEKLHLENRIQAAVYAVQHKLIHQSRESKY